MLKKILEKFGRKTFYGATWHSFGDLKLKWDTKKYLSTYADSLYVFACVRKRAEKVGQVEFKLFDFRSDKQVFDHELLNLLYHPNKFQSKNEFFELYQIFKDLAGSTFIYVEKSGKKIIGLHNLRPDWITEQRNEANGEIVGYKYSNGNKDFKFKPEEVIASHYPSPLNRVGGHSPIESAKSEINTELQLKTYHANVIKNGGRVEGVLTHKIENLTETQIEQMKKEFDEKYAGAKNSGRPLFLYGGLDYKNMGLTPSELSFIESKKFTRDDILTAYQVPLPIVAQSDIGSLGSNGYDAALRIFLSETIKPLIDNLTQKLNEFLIPQDLELKYVDPSPDDTELKLKIAESGTKNYYMTQNEVRALFNLGPIKGGDVILTPFNLVPQEVQNKNFKKKSFVHPLSNKEARAKYYEQHVKSLKQDVKKFKNRLSEYFEQQHKRVMGNQKSKRKAFPLDQFIISDEDKLGVAYMLPVIEEIFMDSGKQIFDLMGSEENFKLTPKAKETLESRAQFFIHEINETTFAELTEIFEESVVENLTRDELIEEVNDLYEDRITEERAATIVRTETHTAIETGKFGGYDQLHIPIKIWVHNPVSKNPRDNHIAMDGEETMLDARFSNGLMYPGDPEGPAEEVINCNCSI